MTESDADTGIAIDVPAPLSDLAARLRIAEEELLEMALALVQRARSALN